MKGGTYAEALKAGFSEQQAGFLGRMSAETRQEAVEYMDQRAARQADERNEKRAKRRFQTFAMFALFGAFAIGVTLGSLFK